MYVLVHMSSGGRAAVFTFVITHGLTVDQFRRLSPHLSAAGVKGQLRLQAWWLMQKLQVDIRAKEVKNRLERMNVSAWVEACLGVRDGNVLSLTLLTFSCT